MEIDEVIASLAVTTNKPRVCGNIDPELYELLCYFLVQRRKKHISYSQSKAIEEICSALLGLGKDRIEKLCRLADADLRSPSDYAQLLLKRALDEID